MSRGRKIARSTGFRNRYAEPTASRAAAAGSHTPEASIAAADLGFPVVVKTAAIQIGTITHKSTALTMGWKPGTGTKGEDFYIGRLRNVSVSIG